MSLSQARRHKRRFDAVVTIEDPSLHRRHFLRFHRDPHPEHLVLRFEDLDDDDLGVLVAERHHVEEAVLFGRRHASGSMLVHCFAGRSRSSAVAYAIIADRLGPGLEDEAIRRVRDIRPGASPNLVVVRHADAVLGRDGALEAALRRAEADDARSEAYRREKRLLFERNPGLFSLRNPPSAG